MAAIITYCNTQSTQPVRADIRIDREQAEEQIKALGYCSLSEIYVRAFFPKDNPKSTNDKEARKANGIEWTELEEWQQLSTRNLLCRQRRRTQGQGSIRMPCYFL